MKHIDNIVYSVQHTENVINGKNYHAQSVVECFSTLLSSLQKANVSNKNDTDINNLLNTYAKQIVQWKQNPPSKELAQEILKQFTNENYGLIALVKNPQALSRNLNENTKKFRELTAGTSIEVSSDDLEAFRTFHDFLANESLSNKSQSMLFNAINKALDDKLTPQFEHSDLREDAFKQYLLNIAQEKYQGKNVFSQLVRDIEPKMQESHRNYFIPAFKKMIPLSEKMEFLPNTSEEELKTPKSSSGSEETSSIIIENSEDTPRDKMPKKDLSALTSKFENYTGKYNILMQRKNAVSLQTGKLCDYMVKHGDEWKNIELFDTVNNLLATKKADIFHFDKLNDTNEQQRMTKAIQTKFKTMEVFLKNVKNKMKKDYPNDLDASVKNTISRSM